MDYLRREHPDATLLAVAESSAVDELDAEVSKLTKVPSEARKGPVVSFDRTFDYEKLNAAFQSVRYGGATIVATNPDPYCPTPEGGIPDCAATLAAIEACTGAHPQRRWWASRASTWPAPCSAASACEPRMSPWSAIACSPTWPWRARRHTGVRC